VMKRYGRFSRNVSHNGRSPHGDGGVGHAGVDLGTCRRWVHTGVRSGTTPTNLCPSFSHAHMKIGPSASHAGVAGPAIPTPAASAGQPRCAMPPRRRLTPVVDPGQIARFRHPLL
jgi:hypothetical protein